jgi:hypothetical protein
VDGSQGGTWYLAHLLGTPALDRFTGYVGLSRSRQPTHTWNTRPDVDHPLSLLADARTPTELVTDALERAEPKTLAAADDPWSLDRQLRAARAEHEAVIAARPPDRYADLLDARRQLQRAERDLDRATGSLEACEWDRRQLGPLARLRPSGRRELTNADTAINHARTRLQNASGSAERARAKVDDLEAAQEDRQRWSRENEWRYDAVRDIDDALGRHWAGVTLNCVRADDPLAFGVDCLRFARQLYTADLRHLDRSLPPDRRTALDHAQATLQFRERNVHQAHQAVGDAETAVHDARRRHWGRRDKPAITTAERHLDDARYRLTTAVESVHDAQATVGTEREAVQQWTDATHATAERRAELGSAVDDLHDALERTRPQRLRDAVGDRTHQLRQVLGPPPRDAAGLTAWYGIADAYETWLDQRPANNDHVDRLLGEPTHPILGLRPGNARDQWNHLATLIDHHDQIITAARELAPNRRVTTIDLDTCRRTVGDIAATLDRTPPRPQLEREGLDLSL